MKVMHVQCIYPPQCMIICVIYMWQDGVVALVVINTICISPRTWVRLPLERTRISGVGNSG